MPDFNNMTVVAAAQVLGNFNSHSDLSVIELEWGIQGRCSQSSKSAHIRDIAHIAITECPIVFTPQGQISMDRALVELAMAAPHVSQEGADWVKLVAGLRLDGFEVCEEVYETGEEDFLGNPRVATRQVLRRMLPNDVLSTGVRAVQSELEALLTKHEFTVAKGHLDQCIAAFSRGDWAASNAQLRSCFEAVIHGMSKRLGHGPQANMAQYLKVLGEASPAFLYPEYNEWHVQDQKTQFVKGLWARLHPEGSHPGLSEEDDCTFRLQIVTITLRLFLRRLDARGATV
ncbi:MAG: hypothetical protein AAGK23_03460 [Pseudomonadota bacterium]